MLHFVLAGCLALRVPHSPNLDRRQLITRAVAVGAGAATFGVDLPAFAADDASPDYAGLKAELADMIKGNPDLGPTFVRLAWHSSGTYDKMTKTGGSQGGTIRFKEELAHGGNAGLYKMVDLLEPVYKKYDGVSYADLYTLAGATAIEAAGVKVPWKAGRVDQPVEKVTPDGRLPDASKGNDPQKTAAALRNDVFYRMVRNGRPRPSAAVPLPAPTPLSPSTPLRRASTTRRSSRSPVPTPSGAATPTPPATAGRGRRRRTH